MKTLLALLLIASNAFASGEFRTPKGIISAGHVSVGTANAAAGSAVLDAESTTQGFLPPQMTTTQRAAIGTPATGLIVYDTSLQALYIYNGTAWEPLTYGNFSSVAHQWINAISSGGVVSSTQPSCSDLSGVAASCSVDATNANNITTGLLGLAEGGTHADLHLTGGTHQVLQQSTVGGNISVGQLASSDLSDNANVVHTNTANTYSAGPQSLGTQVLSVQIPNDSGTGTTINKLAKLSSIGNAVITATTDISGAKGIVVGGAGLTGSADVSQVGQASCAFDGATTSGDYVQISSTVAGDCHDAGSTSPANGQIIGNVLSTNASAGTYPVSLLSAGGSGGGTITTQGGNEASGTATTAFNFGGQALYRSGSNVYIPLPHHSKQYIKNGDFEMGTTAGFSLAHVAFSTANGYFLPTGTAATGTPFDSTHGGTAANAALSINNLHGTSTVLAGQNSSSLISTVASTQGDLLISDSFTIDREDRAKVLTLQFYYEFTAGSSNVNLSGTSSNTFAIWIYDVTGAKWIMPAAAYAMNQGSGQGIATATFQTDSTDNVYQVALINANASSGSYTLDLDDISATAKTAPIGPTMSDWKAWTPTGSWTTNTTYTGLYRQVGSNIEFRVRLALSGAPVGNLNSIQILPNGYAVDTSSWLSATGSSPVISNMEIQAAAGRYISGFGYYLSSNTISPATDAGNTISPTVPNTFGSGDSIELFGSVPVAGLSSNTSQSSDSDNRVVAFQSTGAPTAGPLSNAAWATIKYPAASVDTHAAYNASTGIYTVPVAGFYNVSAQFTLNGSYSNNGQTLCDLMVNGSTLQQNLVVGTISGTVACPVSATGVHFNSGDQIQIQGEGNNWTSFSLFGSGYSWFNITKVGGTPITQATESVSARYTTASTQSIAINATNTINYDTKDYDDHNAVTTGASWVFKAPLPGVYHISWNDRYAGNAGWNAGQLITAAISKNGSTAFQCGFSQAAFTSGPGPGQGGCDIRLNQGDTISKQDTNSTSASSVALNADATVNWIAIRRVAN